MSMESVAPLIVAVTVVAGFALRNRIADRIASLQTPPDALELEDFD